MSSALYKGLLLNFSMYWVMLNDRHSQTCVQFHFQGFSFFFQTDQEYITAWFALIMYHDAS